MTSITLLFFLALVVFFLVRHFSKSSRQKISHPSSPSLHITFYEPDCISIKSKKLDFFGRYVRSPNQQYLLTIGESELGQQYGCYIIIKDDEITLQGTLPHISGTSECDISDEGSFIIGYSLGEPLQSVVYTINVQGKKLFKRTFHANLINVGISPDGHYAVCQLANNKEHRDGGKLVFFNLKAEKPICWKKQPQPGWAENYRFDTQQNILSLVFDKQEFHYDFQGNAIDISDSP